MIGHKKQCPEPGPATPPGAPRRGLWRAWLPVMGAALLSLACQSAGPPQPVADASRTSSETRRRNTERTIKTASGLSIPKPDGGAFKLSDLHGKVVVVDFWATYCPPCVRQMPGLAELSKRYRDRGLEVVGLTLNERSDNSEVEGFLKRFAVDYTIGYADRRLSSAFLNGTEDETGAPPIPQLFVLARDGRLVEHLIGEDPERGLARLEQVINQQLSLAAASY